MTISRKQRITLDQQEKLKVMKQKNKLINKIRNEYSSYKKTLSK